MNASLRVPIRQKTGTLGSPSRYQWGLDLFLCNSLIIYLIISIHIWGQEISKYFSWVGGSIHRLFPPSNKQRRLATGQGLPIPLLDQFHLYLLFSIASTMISSRHFLLVKYTVNGSRHAIATTVHVPSPSEWFNPEKDALLVELQEELILRHDKFSVEEGKNSFDFLTTPSMKIAYKAERSKLKHLLFTKEEVALPWRCHDCELVVWLYPVEADIPVDFIRV